MKSYIELTITTDIESDVELIKNLLSSVYGSYDYGNFNVDTNTDGLADGWVDSSSDSYGLTDPSFLNGALIFNDTLGINLPPSPIKGASTRTRYFNVSVHSAFESFGLIKFKSNSLNTIKMKNVNKKRPIFEIMLLG